MTPLAPRPQPKATSASALTLTTANAKLVSAAAEGSAWTRQLLGWPDGDGNNGSRTGPGQARVG